MYAFSGAHFSDTGKKKHIVFILWVIPEFNEFLPIY